MTSADLTEYFPPLIACQPWKSHWFADKLLQASADTIENFERYFLSFIHFLTTCRVSYQSPVDFDKNPLLENFARVLHLQRDLNMHSGIIKPVEGIKAASTILTKTNEVCIVHVPII